MIVGCGRIARPTLSESATGVMRETVKREVVTHYALRITCLASRAALAARRFHPCYLRRISTSDASILTFEGWDQRCTTTMVP